MTARSLTDLLVAQKLAELAAKGVTRHDAAQALGVDYATIHRWATKFGISFARPKRLDLMADSQRADEMARRYQSGETLAAIGKEFAVTRERVRQILTRTRGFDRTDGGAMIRATAKSIEVQARRDRDCLIRWGCTYAQHRDVVAIGREMRREGHSYSTTPMGAFASQKCNARRRGIEWRMTFWQWWTIWQQSGRWDDRGRGHGFVMCRIRDAGAYSPENVVIAPGHFNASDQARKKSGLPTGVSVQRNKFIAKMKAGVVMRTLGVFPTAEAAHQAYLSAIAELAGHKSEVAA